MPKKKPIVDTYEGVMKHTVTSNTDEVEELNCRLEINKNNGSVVFKMDPVINLGTPITAKKKK